MKKDFISTRPFGSEKNEPKVIGEVLNEYFQSNEPVAIAYRKHHEVVAKQHAVGKVNLGPLFP